MSFYMFRCVMASIASGLVWGALVYPGVPELWGCAVYFALFSVIPSEN